MYGQYKRALHSRKRFLGNPCALIHPLKHLLKRPSVLFQGLAENRELFLFELERRRYVEQLGARRLQRERGRSLQRRMEDDVGVAGVALKLEQHKVIPRHPDRAKVDRHPLAALGTPHLLFDFPDDELQSVGIKIHHHYSTMKRRGRERFPGFVLA